MGLWWGKPGRTQLKISSTVTTSTKPPRIFWPKQRVYQRIYTQTHTDTRAPQKKPEAGAGGRVSNDETEVLTRYPAIIAVVAAVVPSAGGTRIERERNEKDSALNSKGKLTRARFIAGFSCYFIVWKKAPSERGKGHGAFSFWIYCLPPFRWWTTRVFP